MVGALRETEPIEKRKNIYLDMAILVEREIYLKIWLQTDKLEIQVRVMGAVSSPKSIGQARLEIQVGFLCHSLEAACLLSQEISSFTLNAFN